MNPAIALLAVPLSFQPNVGQLDARVAFYGRAAGEQVFVVRQGVRVGLNDAAFELDWPGAALRFEPEQKLPGTSSWFIGNDPARWRSAVPTYAALRSRGAYPGIDLTLHASAGGLEYDLELAPHADPRQVRLAFRGVERSAVDAQGDLLLTVGSHVVRQLRPRVEQGGRAVDARYVRRAGGWGLELGPYDVGAPLLVDPVVETATYLGGSGGDDAAVAVAVAPSGDIFVSGGASSADFPTTMGAYKTSRGFPPDAFVTRFDPTGKTVVYSTYYGGSSLDYVSGMTVDNAGNAIVVGFTRSTNLPMLNSYRSAFVASVDGYVVKLNPTGTALVFTTYLGGSIDEYASAAATDSLGNVFVTGCTVSSDFPTTPNAMVTTYRGSGGCDAFLAMFPPAGLPVQFVTLLGAGGYTWGLALTADGDGNAYVGGEASISLPKQRNAFTGGNVDAFVTKFAPDGGALFSRFIGGHNDDSAQAIALDAIGDITLGGETLSQDFPTSPGAYQTYLDGDAGVNEGFVARFDPTGNTVVHATCYGTGATRIMGVGVDDAGFTYLTGSTSGGGLATAGAAQTTLSGASDSFIGQLDPFGQLTYGSYFGGSGDERASGLAMAGPDQVVAVGATTSTDFGVVLPYQATAHLTDGGQTGWVARFDFPFQAVDAGPPAPDAGPGDGGPGDGGPSDAGPQDAGLDAGPPEAGDGGLRDAGPTDAGDGGSEDAGDAGVETGDGGSPDGGLAARPFYDVGCACRSVGPVGWLAALAAVTGGRRRRGRPSTRAAGPR